MIPWLNEKPVTQGLKLRVGFIAGYLPPLRARVVLLGLAVVSVIAGAKLVFSLLSFSHAIVPQIEKTGLPGWTFYFIWFLPVLLPVLILRTRCGQFLGEILFGCRFTIVVSKEYMQVIRWFVYRPKYPLGPGIAFERVPHPKAKKEILGNQLRRIKYPNNPIKGMQFDQYQKAMVVVFRSGAKVVRLATIYDRTPVELGHKADALIHTLQRLHSESQTGNLSSDSSKTSLQYGTRPSIA